MYRYILAFDPSGSFNEGKGTTGWVLMDSDERLLERGYISAEQYNCPEAYWNNHIVVLEKYWKRYQGNLIVVIEDYVLYRDRSDSQTNSQMETCRLIGVLLWKCWQLRQPYTLQLASMVKNRWSDELLFREGIIYRDGRNIIHRQSGISLGLIHTRDAFRHAQHYAVCRNHKIDRPKKYYRSNTSRRESRDYQDFVKSNY
jgi:hypothetical protein